MGNWHKRMRKLRQNPEVEQQKEMAMDENYERILKSVHEAGERRLSKFLMFENMRGVQYSPEEIERMKEKMHRKIELVTRRQKHRFMRK